MHRRWLLVFQLSRLSSKRHLSLRYLCDGLSMSLIAHACDQPRQRLSTLLLQGEYVSSINHNQIETNICRAHVLVHQSRGVEGVLVSERCSRSGTLYCSAAFSATLITTTFIALGDSFASFQKRIIPTAQATRAAKPQHRGLRLRRSI